jgi:hypothetical protein
LRAATDRDGVLGRGLRLIADGDRRGIGGLRGPLPAPPMPVIMPPPIAKPRLPDKVYRFA